MNNIGPANQDGWIRVEMHAEEKHPEVEEEKKDGPVPVSGVAADVSAEAAAMQAEAPAIVDPPAARPTLFRRALQDLLAALGDRAESALAMPHPRPLAYAAGMAMSGSDLAGSLGGAVFGRGINYTASMLNEQGRMAHAAAEIIGFGVGSLISTRGGFPDPTGTDTPDATYGLIGASVAGTLALGVGLIFMRAPQGRPGDADAA